ncbi:MAG: ABC transporter permease [Ruminococcaceae bacterium]|nr:ABC transporter permease [Oscillospiraceae bacterium]
MYRYILKRILMVIPVLLGVIIVVQGIMELNPADPVYQIVGESATEEQIEAAREEYGLNDPFVVRLGRYIWNFCHGDLGTSYTTRESVMKTYWSQLPATIELAVVAVVVGLLLSQPLGIHAATHQNSLTDSSCMIFSLIGVSMPGFWSGLLLMLLFALYLGWLPSAGNDHWYSVILPGLTQGFYMTGFMTRSTRSAMLETVRSDYMTTALAKGVNRKKAVMKHAYKNAQIPIVTAAGVQFAHIIGGSVTVEKLFSWPGVGRALVTAITSRDIPVVTGYITMTAVLICLVNLVIDIIYAFIDPRIKAQYSGKR